MSVLEVSGEVTSILLRKRLTFQDNLEELPFRRVARGLATRTVLMVDVAWKLMAKFQKQVCRVVIIISLPI
jgi:hypothetical protein